MIGWIWRRRPGGQHTQSTLPIMSDHLLTAVGRRITGNYCAQAALVIQVECRMQARTSQIPINQQNICSSLSQGYGEIHCRGRLPLAGQGGSYQDYFWRTSDGGQEQGRSQVTISLRQGRTRLVSYNYSKTAVVVSFGQTEAV